jgi:hypothetical protein
VKTSQLIRTALEEKCTDWYRDVTSQVHSVFWNKKSALKYVKTNQQAYVELRTTFLYTKKQNVS